MTIRPVDTENMETFNDVWIGYGTSSQTDLYLATKDGQQEKYPDVASKESISVHYLPSPAKIFSSLTF